MIAVPGVYDGLHFAHLRTGSRLAGLMHAALAIASDLIRTRRVTARPHLTTELATLMTAALGVG